MEQFRLFNGITLLIVALTLAMLVARLKGRGGWWPSLYYLVIAAFALGFPYSLNLYGVLAGILCAVLIRARVFGRLPRVGEFAVLAYVSIRCLGLLLMW